MISEAQPSSASLHLAKTEGRQPSRMLRGTELAPESLRGAEGQRAPNPGQGFPSPLGCPPPGCYLVGGPCLLVGPIPVAPHVPPLDLQRVGRGAAAAEGAGHLHVLACPRRHIVRRLCEQSCARNREAWRGSGPAGAGSMKTGRGSGPAGRGLWGLGGAEVDGGRVYG
jgi:hypothetical protein